MKIQAIASEPRREAASAGKSSSTGTASVRSSVIELGRFRSRSTGAKASGRGLSGRSRHRSGDSNGELARRTPGSRRTGGKPRSGRLRQGRRCRRPARAASREAVVHGTEVAGSAVDVVSARNGSSTPRSSAVSASAASVPGRPCSRARGAGSRFGRTTAFTSAGGRPWRRAARASGGRDRPAALANRGRSDS